MTKMKSLCFPSAALCLLLLLADTADGFAKKLASARHRSKQQLFVVSPPNTNNHKRQQQIVTLARLPQDLDAIRKCRATAFADVDQPLLASQRSFVNATAVALGKSTCWVAREKNKGSSSSSLSVVVGTADVKVRGDVATIYNVFVAPSARGRGIGRSLLKGMEQSTREDDRVRQLSLAVDTSNTPAVSLYRSCGFEALGIHAAVAFVGNLTGFGLQIQMTKDLKQKGSL